MKSKKHRSNESKIAYVILCGAGVIALVFCFILLFTGRVRTFDLTGGSNEYYIGEELFEMSGEPLMIDDVSYVPAKDILAQCGYEIDWDSEKYAMTVSDQYDKSYIYPDRDVVTRKGENVSCNNAAFMLDKIIYVPVEMISLFTEDRIEIAGEVKKIIRPVRDLMADTYINDDYRSTESPVKCNGVYMIGEDKAMEMLAYPDNNCTEYAAVINRLATAFPEAQVYDIAIPSMAEFYGPKPVYTDQTSGIRKIYENLGLAVMPVNAVKELWAHAGEKLYFNTDHHWTQRGAYYAYKAFLATKGEQAPPLESFETNNIDDFMGSWANTVKGTSGEAQLKAHPELMERFMPKVEYTGDIFLDQAMTNRSGDSKVINLSDKTYGTFICGDQPLTRYTTNVKNGKKAVLLKESFGNAFATWLINDYEEVYVIDPRYWNGGYGRDDAFTLRALYDEIGGFDDIIVVSYPVSAAADMRKAIGALIGDQNN